MTEKVDPTKTWTFDFGYNHDTELIRKTQYVEFRDIPDIEKKRIIARIISMWIPNRDEDEIVLCSEDHRALY